MNGTPTSSPIPQHEPSRVWTIAVPPVHAQRLNVALVLATATQMGEVIVTLIDTSGGVSLLVYSADEAIKLAECKAVCDKFAPPLWAMITEWRTKHARTPWSYIGANKPRSALRERYWRGTDPGTLMRPVGDVEAVDPVEAVAVVAEIEAPPEPVDPESLIPDPEPDFWSDGGQVANFDRARREDIERFRRRRPQVQVVGWSRLGAADERTFQAAKARSESER